MTINLMSIVSSTAFLFQSPNYKKAMLFVFPTPFLFQRITNKSKVGKNSNMNFTLLLVFSMALKTVAIPIQPISEDSLMVSQNNAYGNQKFRLKVHRNILVAFKMDCIFEHECESLNFYLYVFMFSLCSNGHN